MKINRNFSFETVHWAEEQWFYSFNGGVLTCDTISYMDGKQSWVVTTSPFSQRFHAYLFQYFSLPHPVNNISASICSKTEIVENAWLKIYLLDKDENLVSRDSVSIISSGEWSRSSLKLLSEDACKMYLEIQAQSKDTIILDDRIKPKLWVDDLKIKLNGKNIRLFPGHSQLSPKELADNLIDNHLTLNIDSLEISKINDFKNHGIIALGESVHGSMELQLFAFETIRNMIAINNCKLVLLELPFEIGLHLDDYVTGETNEDIEKLLTHFNYKTEEIIKLFNWIRAFNKNKQSKVHLAGVDINHSSLGKNHLIKFLESQREKAPGMDTIVQLVKQAQYNKAMMTLKQSKSIRLSLNQTKYKSILRALMYRNGLLFPTPSLVDGDREFIQFQNAKFAIDSYLADGDKAIIYAHLGHVNKRNSTQCRLFTPSFGNYMDKQYLSDYFVTALLVGEGTITSTDSLFCKSKLRIQNPEPESIEYLCMKSQDAVFYKNLCGVVSTQSCRSIGTFPLKNQFFPFNHKGRYDAIVFFKNSTSYML
ncbi:erythromycin esterase family protein [Gaoshiqia sp. Z1-71]|uniref:erythromycin esterase family protein n=1 Tax=Gaoshiqia hydrogeniformans TaxID=3290090 RepID=UPI003BF85DFF